MTSWTYLFLGHRDTVIQSSAVRPGDAFTYVAGGHVGKPGRTKVTVLAYHAQKVVVKTPQGLASRREPVVRRTETCIGELRR